MSRSDEFTNMEASKIVEMLEKQDEITCTYCDDSLTSVIEFAMRLCTECAVCEYCRGRRDPFEEVYACDDCIKGMSCPGKKYEQVLPKVLINMVLSYV